ncbi:MAG: TetR/AcrR family transcriptional regulator [Candidatus Limnocylindria bacterium]
MVETARRREIEDAASVLFRERGYAATSVRDIARALDIQGASLYAHVTSKQEVLWSIVDGTATRFEAAAQHALAQHAEPRDRLAALVRGHVAVLLDDIGRASVFIHDWRSLDAERRATILRRRDAYERHVREVIEAGVAAGRFEVADPGVAAAFILTALNGIVVWYRPDGRLDAAGLQDVFADLALRAVGAGRDDRPGAA